MCTTLTRGPLERFENCITGNIENSDSIFIQHKTARDKLFTPSAIEKKPN